MPVVAKSSSSASDRDWRMQGRCARMSRPSFPLAWRPKPRLSAVDSRVRGSAAREDSEAFMIPERACFARCLGSWTSVLPCVSVAASACLLIVLPHAPGSLHFLS